jgi:hypothetical protein
MTIRYDEVAERYFDGDRPIIRVTHVLDVLEPPSSFYTDEHRARGQAVHAACQILGEGDCIVPGSLDPRLDGYVAAFNLWRLQMQPILLATETVVYNELLGYAGRRDALVQLPGVDLPFATDYKSGPPQRRVGPQTSGYVEADPRTSGGRALRAALQLKKNGTYSWFTELDSPRLFQPDDFDSFVSALNVIRWRES